ncbi:MAG: glycosyltransferase family 2 protein [Verrucomicrobiota bacterium]|nr:glycosyltransferase family 2 protein [Verrucomicrobiota bacterium]
MNLWLSIVICTFNRARLLEIVLESLKGQTKWNDERYEVLVIDNNSTDNTALVCEQFGVKRVQETKQGLSHSRNRGAEESRGTYVAYVDDDCRIPEGWLEEAFKIMDREKPDVFGGPFFAFYLDPKPVWFKDAYGSWEIDGKVGDITATETTLCGGNFFIRKELLIKMGGFDPAFGMVGGRIAYGEETVLQKRIRAKKPEARFYYDPALYVYHLVRPGKMHVSTFLKQRIADGRDYYHFAGKDEIGRAGKIKTVFLMAVRLLAFGVETGGALFCRNRKELPFVANAIVEKTSRHIRAIGMYNEHFKTAPWI